MGKRNSQRADGLEPGVMVTAEPTAPRAPGTTPTTPGHLLRLWGVVVLVLFLVTSVIGGSLAGENSYLPVALAGHIGLAVVTLAVAGYATSVVGRRYRALPRASAGIAALAALGATIAGTIFLVGGQSNPALYAMEGFAGLGIVAAILMIVFGGPSGNKTPG